MGNKNVQHLDIRIYSNQKSLLLQLAIRYLN